MNGNSDTQGADMFAHEISRGEPDEATRASFRVLAIDDEEHLLKVYRRILEPEGFEVLLAQDAREVPAILERDRPEAVLSDVLMPHLDGIAVLRAVRARDPDLPVILISAYQTLESAVQAIEHGALRYLAKPFEPEELVRVMRGAVLQYRAALTRRAALGQLQSAPSLAALGADLESAIGTVALHFQPLVSAESRRVVAFEALMRPSHATLSNPSSMLEAAEQLGQVHRLGRLVRELAARAVDQLPPGVDLLVNLHPLELDDAALWDPGSPLSGFARRVVLEITERATLAKVAQLQQRMDALRGLGFRIAVDDIGSGYSGLTSFALLRPELVKIDMALVRGIDSDATRARIVRAMIELSHSLGVVVVGEGVETREERDALVEMRCDLLQGYLFGKAAPTTAVDAHLWDGGRGAT